MTREQLEKALQEVPIPDEARARERVRRTLLAAHEHHTAPRRRRTVALVWVAIAASVATVVITQRDSGAARAFERIFQRVVSEPAKPTPTPTPSGLELPTRGRLLVGERDGLWVVERSGRRTRIAAARDATWSPGGLFVAAADGRTLSALEPDDGAVRWRRRLAAHVSHPRWAPDGTHIAYRAGDKLHVVYGNGLHDVIAGRRMAAVAPAWRPSEPHDVAWAASDGTVTVEDADTAKVLWTRYGGTVSRLAWSPDGRRLLIAGRRTYTIHDLATNARETTRLPRGSQIVAAAFAPSGTRLALAIHQDGQTELQLAGQTVLKGPGRLRDLEWSPDGRWLLAGWPTADHWLLVRTSAGARDSAVSGVRHRFDASARTLGWAR